MPLPALRRCLLMAAISLVCFTTGALASDRAAIPVGVAKIDITPEYAVRLSGFGGRREESEGVTMKIWAKALAFSDEDGPVILITADNLCVPDEITSDIARRLHDKIGLKRERLTITATHTHTAPMLKDVCPTLFGVPIPADHEANIDRYTAEFTDKLEGVALAAHRNIRPAHLSWGNGLVTFAANRRTQGGPVDHDFPVLAVHDLDGKLRAAYFSYACHCVTLSDNKISGDWAGFAQHRIEELFPGAIALASVGCGADSNPTSGVTGANVEVCAKQGEEIAQEFKRLLANGLKPINSKPEPRYTRVDIPFDTPRSRAEWEERAKRQDAVGHHARVTLERLDRGEKLPEKMNYPIQTWVFGDELAIVFLPGETVVDYSLRLKREYDRSRLWVNGYSNDGRCYIPSERILKEGGYEGGDAMIYYDFPQRFAPGLEQKIISAVAAELPPSFKAPPGTEGTRPLSATEALRHFRTKPGLKVELAASEPLIQDPVAIDWGADGKLWVCEMHDYPSGLDSNWQPGGRVKFLTDTNGDGLYDSSTIFLEKLPFPTGITAWGRGLFVCAAPDILYAEDTDGDGKADKVEKLFTGFHTDNYQARVNSLSLGLDNWIYGANGLLGGTIQPLENSLFPADEPLNIRNRDFRFHPFRGTFETVSGLTQQGRVRDDWGNWFGCDNSNLLFNYTLPERYIRRNPHVPVSSSVRNLTARPDGNRLFPTSPLLERFNDPAHANRVTSAVGLEIYRDVLLGEEYYGNAFPCETVHNLVHREVLSRTLGFSSRRASDEVQSEFLSSSDNWFRPVQARTGPDGALYIVDMYRFLIEHPRWIPAARLAQIDVRAGADRGRIYRVVNVNKPLRPIRDLTKLSGENLASALDTPNGTDRDRVHAELLLRKDLAAVPKLTSLARQADAPQVRVQALAILDGLGALESAQVRDALGDSYPGVREHGLRLAEPFLQKGGSGASEMLGPVIALTNDSSAVVLRQLAFTLGESSDARAGRALASLAKIWLANAEIRAAILSSAVPHCAQLLSAIMTTDPGALGRADWIAPLIATAANSSDEALMGQAIRAILPPPGTAPREEHFIILATFLESADSRKLDLTSILERDANSSINGVARAAATLAADSDGEESSRVAAIRLLGRAGSGDELELLSQLATGASERLRRAAISVLKRQRGAAMAESLLKRWPSTSPGARAELIALMIGRDESTAALLNAVRDGIVQASEISQVDRQRLASSGQEEIRKIAAEVLPAQAATGRNEVIEKYESVPLTEGVASKGAEVFAKNCAACHALNGIGQNVGPDLAALRGRDAEYWLKNILDPNAVVEPRFVNYMIELEDDRMLGGLIKSENANSLTILSGAGVSETVLRSQVRDIRASSLSLMPEGLEQAISPGQMADLIAFIESGAARKELPGNAPQLVSAGNDGVLMLRAAHSEIYGADITFEAPFQNIGMWHGPDDYVVWAAQIGKAGAYDVFLDYACAANSAGNKFVLTAADQRLTGSVSATGVDWSNYKQIRIGRVELPVGAHRITLRPEGALQSALIDLRSIALAPPGKSPRWPNAAPADPEVLRDPVSVARYILDSSRPGAAREAVVNANPQFAGALIAEMTRDLKPGTPEEYARIPWIWRVAIAGGKRNDTGQIRAVLENSLPQENEPLRDWQAVVIGGGIINGISQRGLWPGERIAQILEGSAELKARWGRALDLSAAMADDQKVPTGTRYDALRMIALQPWEKRGAQLVRYLSKDSHSELQMGAVSGLVDMPVKQAGGELIKALHYLEGQNRDLALEGLLRDDSRRTLLLDALEDGRIEARDLRVSFIEKLVNGSTPDINERARKLAQRVER